MNQALTAQPSAPPSSTSSDGSQAAIPGSKPDAEPAAAAGAAPPAESQAAQTSLDQLTAAIAAPQKRTASGPKAKAGDKGTEAGSAPKKDASAEPVSTVGTLQPALPTLPAQTAPVSAGPILPAGNPQTAGEATAEPTGMDPGHAAVEGAGAARARPFMLDAAAQAGSATENGAAADGAAPQDAAVAPNPGPALTHVSLDASPAVQTSAAVPQANGTQPGAAPMPPPSSPAAAPANPTPYSASATPAGQVAAKITDQVQFSLAAPSQPGAPHTVTIQLKPAELGRVEVRIERSAEGPTKVELAVERTDTLMMLVRDQSHLHQALDQAGVPQDGRTVQFSLSSDNLGNAGSNLFGNGSSNGGSQRSPYQYSGGRSAEDAGPTTAYPGWIRPGLDITA